MPSRGAVRFQESEEVNDSACSSSTSRPHSETECSIQLLQEHAFLGIALIPDLGMEIRTASCISTLWTIPACGAARWMGCGVAVAVRALMAVGANGAFVRVCKSAIPSKAQSIALAALASCFCTLLVVPHPWMSAATFELTSETVHSMRTWLRPTRMDELAIGKQALGALLAPLLLTHQSRPVARMQKMTVKQSAIAPAHAVRTSGRVGLVAVAVRACVLLLADQSTRRMR